MFSAPKIFLFYLYFIKKEKMFQGTQGSIKKMKKNHAWKMEQG